MDSMDQRLDALNAEMSKVKGELAAAGAKAQATSGQKLAELRAKANAVMQQAGAATHAGLSKFHAELADLEAKVKGAINK
ncbi:MAG TPA: hypothetical protein VNV25_08910 [Gemmatimonadaceae bacterium]|jgi:hypothetical protein|nr:hypothetical protein [Gemmatimonadaceae bacterium]